MKKERKQREEGEDRGGATKGDKRGTILYRPFTIITNYDIIGGFGTKFTMACTDMTWRYSFVTAEVTFLWRFDFG